MMQNSYSSHCSEKNYEIVNYLWIVLNLMQLFPVTIILFKRMYEELSWTVIDMFKVMQYSFAIIMFTSNIFHILMVQINSRHTFTWIEAHAIRDLNIINFQFSNQIWWFIMIVHLSHYKRISTLCNSNLK